MNIIEHFISSIAPHKCLGCGLLGKILCNGCANELKYCPSRCYICQTPTLQYQTCKRCSKDTNLARVWVIALHEGYSKEIVHKLKYERVKSASKDIAKIISSELPIMPNNIVITHLPTANKRIRVRGYDQAQLIAKHLAKKTKSNYEVCLSRKGNQRQVGSNRSKRLKQLKDAFCAKNLVNGRHVLLVDDVLTTGASLETAALTLKKAGAKKIEAVVFTQSL